MHCSGSKILAFFGSDLRDAAPDYLTQCTGDGYTLLALDPLAVRHAISLGVAYTVPGHWLSIARRMDVRRTAAIWERNWFEPIRDAFTFDDICWPAFDRHAMMWFWQEAVLADALAESFIASNVCSLRFFSQSSVRPSVLYLPADIFSCYWQMRLARDIEIVVESPVKQLQGTAGKSRLPWRRSLAWVHRKLGKLTCLAMGMANGDLHPKSVSKNSSSESMVVPFSALQGKVVLAFNIGELTRFSPVMRKLIEQLPGEIAAATVFPSETDAERAARTWNIPVAVGASQSTLSPELSMRFLRAMDEARACSNGQPWEPILKNFDFHFGFYCTQRWPGLVAALQFWSEQWQQTPPRAVLVSSLYNAESQLPAEAANRLKIPTYSLPHGGIQLADNLISAKNVLYSYETQKRKWELSGIESDRLRSCRALVSANEYPSTPHHGLIIRKKKYVLVLVNPVMPSDRRLLPGTCILAQIEALSTLATPPNDCAENIEIRVKVHPGWPELGLIEAVSQDLRAKVLPSDTMIEPVLADADLVIGLNYVGSALLHVHKAGKPIIHFWPDALVGFEGTSTFDCGFLEGGRLVRIADELWSTIRTLIRTPDEMNCLRQQSKEFYMRYLDDSNYPELTEILTTTQHDYNGTTDH